MDQTITKSDVAKSEVGKSEIAKSEIAKPEVPRGDAAGARPAAAPPRTPRRGLRLRFNVFRPRNLAVMGLLLAALAYGGHELYMRLTHVYEYDARISADMITISSRVDGFVTDMPVEEGTRLPLHAIVAQIDDRVSKLKVDGLRAQIQSVQAERNRLEAERRMTQNQVATRARTRVEAIRVTEAARAVIDSDIALALQEKERQQALYQRGVGTEKSLQAAEAAVIRLQNQRRQIDAERAQAEGNLDEAHAEQDKLAVTDTQIAALQHTQSNLEAQLAQQVLDVEDRTMRSPVPAVIDRLFVKPGEYVYAGQRLLMLHDPDALWIEANIKETQVRSLKVGQKVKVSVDAFPDDVFVGRVARIGSATTARFALLPTPNPSGNFTKITQRVAVKIEIVESPRQLAPGMMVEVDIDIR